MYIPADALVSMDPISDAVEGENVMVCIDLIGSPGSELQCPLEVTVEVSDSTKTG